VGRCRNTGTPTGRWRWSPARPAGSGWSWPGRSSGVLSEGRPLDAVALNAGVGVNGELTRIPLEDDLNLIAVNVTAVVHLAKRALPRWRAGAPGGC
jgi:NAD(P)-dependent dehydrogenase (short-subunit alcohol dehydrogenase family)